MPTLRIVADENMPYVAEHFAHLGDVVLRPGRGMTPADVAEADVLLVRSITKVGEPLLAGSRIRFVGTATIGTDHVDRAWLTAQGIGFSSAPGCNAESVAQWIAAAVTHAAALRGDDLAAQSIGIVGAGNCGARAARVAAALGLRVVLNDPPLARATGDARYRPLAEALACNIVALHVPLTREGEDRTLGLIGARELAQLPDGALLINACRGGVVDEAALRTEVDAGRLRAILDAWIGEPRIDPATHARVLLGTPHIAGYSFDGKVAGTRMVYEATCQQLGLALQTPRLALPPASTPALRIEVAHRSPESVLAELVQCAYPILRDHATLAHALRAAGSDTDARGAAFDQCRKRYPLRREFAATCVELPGAEPALIERARLLGFSVT